MLHVALARPSGPNTGTVVAPGTPVGRVHLAGSFVDQFIAARDRGTVERPGTVRMNRRGVPAHSPAMARPDGTP
jgi:hypothetical protein